VSKISKVAAVNNDAMLAIPSELSELANELGGLVQVRSELLKPARIKLLQQMSQANGGLGKSGEFVCETSGMNYGDKITLIPLMLKESASLMYSQNNPPRAVVNGSVDPDSLTDGMPICHTKDLITNKDGINCKSCPWGENWNDWKDGKPPKCKLSIDLFCIPEGSNQVVLMQFMKTSYNAGKDLVNKITQSGSAPFTFKYTLKSKDQTQDKYRFKVVDASSITKQQLTQEELNQYYAVIADFLNKRKAKQIEYDVVQHDEVESTINAAEDIPI